MPYFIPASDTFGVERANLNLGLLAAARFYNESVFPGIGGAYRVRHLSWAVAGLALKARGTLSVSATKIANGLEGLSNKVWWHSLGDQTQARNRGKLAFARHPDEWSFAKLSERTYYVQVTHRQQCSRALPQVTGLGLSEGSSRFNGMVLSQVGLDLANAFMDVRGVTQGSPRLFVNLEKWIRGDWKVDGYQDALAPLLSPPDANEKERAIVRDCLSSEVDSRNIASRIDPQRRRRMVEYFESHRSVRGTEWDRVDDLIRWLETRPGGPSHAADLRTALVFDDLRAAGVEVFVTVAKSLNRSMLQMPITSVVAGESVKLALNQFRVSARAYLAVSERGTNSHPDVLKLCRFVEDEDVALLTSLLELDGRVLVISNQNVVAGPLFDRIDVTTVADERATEDLDARRPARLFQFLDLMRDAHGD